MSFEHDKKKSMSNKLKHNIEFKEAQELWNDEELFDLKSNIKIWLVERLERIVATRITPL